ncbi:hypothetical protein PG996_013928 [Apiospora saccharicola]|uniref:FAR1 domain-containing protein n=1 Tax=Apiospora saccharicola TaxID=335842 RepID=A0ABR1TGV9_9PEZI
MFALLQVQDPLPPDTHPAVAALSNMHWAKYEDAEKALKAAAEQAGFGVSKSCAESKDPVLDIYRRHVFSCWKAKAKAPSRTKIEAAALVPPEKKRKRESTKGTCEWQGVIKSSTRDNIWTFSYVKGRNRHDHEMELDAAGIPTNRKRARDDLGIAAEVETLAIHPRATTTGILEEIQRRHSGIQLKRHDVNNMLKKFKEDESSAAPIEGQQYVNLSWTRPGFWYRVISKLPPESRMIVWDELQKHNGGAADAPGSPDYAQLISGPGRPPAAAMNPSGFSTNGMGGQAPHPPGMIQPGLDQAGLGP